MPNTTQLLLYEETIMHNDHAISSKCVLCHILHSKFCLCYCTRQFLLFHRFRSWLTKCTYRTISKNILFFKTCQKLLFIRTWPTRQVLIYWKHQRTSNITTHCTEFGDDDSEEFQGLFTYVEVSTIFSLQFRPQPSVMIYAWALNMTLILISFRYVFMSSVLKMLFVLWEMLFVLLKIYIDILFSLNKTCS